MYVLYWVIKIFIIVCCVKYNKNRNIKSILQLCTKSTFEIYNFYSDKLCSHGVCIYYIYSCDTYNITIPYFINKNIPSPKAKSIMSLSAIKNLKV